MPGHIPAVSVILPAYNAGNYVGAAIESILSQTFSDLELLLIDDGSTDDTLSIALGIRDPRLRVLRNPRNMGLVASLNHGIAEAHGALLARMDADDVSAPERLAVQVQWIEAQPRVGVLSCHYSTFDDQHFALDTVALPISDAGVRHNLYAKTHCFCHPAVLMRRAALEQAGGYRAEWFPAEDRELWMRMLETWHGANVPQVLHHMRIHGNSISRQNMRRQNDLVVKATAAALARRQTPVDANEAAQRSGWSRGELFLAFAAASNGETDPVNQHLLEAMSLDADAASNSFEELLRERIASYMHHSGADVDGCLALLQRIFDALPPSLAPLRALQPRLQSQIHAIAAYHHAQIGDMKQSKREAARALLADRHQWRNRGLIKLAMGVG